jgi:hypothetical protein
MAKRKKQSKISKRAKLRRGNVAKPAAAKRPVARAKPKRATVKKVARQIKQPVASAVETVAAEVIEQPVTVTDEASTGPAL